MNYEEFDSTEAWTKEWENVVHIQKNETSRMHPSTEASLERLFSSSMINAEAISESLAELNIFHGFGMILARNPMIAILIENEPSDGPIGEMIYDTILEQFHLFFLQCSINYPMHRFFSAIKVVIESLGKLSQVQESSLHRNIETDLRNIFEKNGARSKIVKSIDSYLFDRSSSFIDVSQNIHRCIKILSNELGEAMPTTALFWMET